jgi:hypothetical protein
LPQVPGVPGLKLPKVNGKLKVPDKLPKLPKLPGGGSGSGSGSGGSGGGGGGLPRLPGFGLGTAYEGGSVSTTGGFFGEGL